MNTFTSQIFIKSHNPLSVAGLVEKKNHKMIQDIWLEAIPKKEMAAIVLFDLNAAFDFEDNTHPVVETQDIWTDIYFESNEG